MSTQGFTVAAAMLGDELETVLRRYAHLQLLDAGQQADRFLVELFEHENFQAVDKRF